MVQASFFLRAPLRRFIVLAVAAICLQGVTVSVASTPPSSCTGTSGPLTVRVNATRSSGISPFLVFFNATGTTDSSITGKTTTFQDVSYSWNFGDNKASGRSTWEHGSNKGNNSRNVATGGVAAHLYITEGADTGYTVTVTAHDGTYTASCQVGVTAYDPAGANGFPGTQTTCVSASGTPTPGSGGCPAGAAVLRTSSFTQGTASAHAGAGKRVLFKCGDTFTGSSSLVSGAKWSIGAYGGCQGTQTNRPIMLGNTNINMQATGDGRVADLDFERVGANAPILANNNYDYVNYQLTFFNLLSNGNDASYYVAQCSQCGYIQLQQTGMGTHQGTFINFAENNQQQWGTNSLFNNINYQAVLGGFYDGQGAPNGTAGIETMRISACRLCVISNNTIENANDVGAVLKLHNGNTKYSSSTWTGVYTEFIEISDNLFAGTSGAQLVETSPQNGVTDERLRNIVIERNIFQPAGSVGRQILVSAVNATLRDNAFYHYGYQGMQIAKRGIEPVPQYVEVYNNTCYGIGFCANFSGTNFAAPGINSFAKNNLCYKAGCIANSGSGNTIGNNTVTTSNNPNFTNASGTFSFISDFQPNQNYSGGTRVPVWSDALNAPWNSAWDLGALHP